MFLFRDTTACVKQHAFGDDSAAFDWLLTDSPLGSRGLDTAENASVWWWSPWTRPSASVGIQEREKEVRQDDGGGEAHGE